MAGDVAERQSKAGKGLRRPKRRISVRIDMTPMVDIAFLLLIFYMVSTVFAMPQAMEINLPPKELDEELIVKESNLLTIRVDNDSKFWWNLKIVTPKNLPQLIPSAPKPDSIDYAFNADSLRGLLVTQNRANNRLSTLVLIHEDGSYADMVNILDEIDVIERSWNQFTADQQGVKVEDIPKKDKFSYRYAIGKWDPKDDKKISEAKLARASGEPQ